MQKRSRTRKRTTTESLKLEASRLTEPFRVVLSNAVTIIGEHLPFVESAAIGVWINVGSRDEEPEENGLTHLIEHMVFKGTEHFTGSQIVDLIEGRGGYINAFTTKEFSCYYAKVFKEDIEHALQVLSDLVIYPKFGEKDLLTERKVVLSELHEVMDDPEDWGMDHIEEKMFNGNPLAMTIIGKASSIVSFGAGDLRRFHSKNFTADRIVISAAGNIDRSEFIRLASKYFSDLDSRIKFHIRKRPTQNRAGRFSLRQSGGKQTHILLGAVAPGLDSRDRFAAAMVGVILGDGSSSRLYKNVREKEGLAYSIYSYGSSYMDVGVMGVYAGTSSRDAGRAEDRIFSTIDEFAQQGPTAEEVSRAKAQLKAGIVFSLENPWDRASLFARDELCYGHKANLAESLQSIENVKPSEIVEAARKYFMRERITSLIILPENTVARKITNRRKLKPRR